MRRFPVGLLLIAVWLIGCTAPTQPGSAAVASSTIPAAPTAFILHTVAATTSAATHTPAATSTPVPVATAVNATATLEPPTPAPLPPSPTQLPPSAPPSPTALPGPSDTPTPRVALTPVPPPPLPSSPTSRPGAGPTAPNIDIIVDNRDSGFSTTGHWFIGDGGQSYGGDCAWAPRGIGNIAYVKPALPLRGAYEIFAWWCGDPNGDQAERAQIQIYPTVGRVATFPVYVNLQENAGQWRSLGVYPLETNGFLSIDSGLHGNVVADAFRFVYRSPERTSITPTPLPTPILWSNHPPSPLEQLTAGDLSARLGLTRRFYTASPLIVSQETTFDDCQAFPRDGCGGARPGWRVRVGHRQMTVAYRVSQDYRHVAIEPPPDLAGRQSLYLYGSQGARFFRVDRYPDDVWMLSAAPLDAEAPATSMPLEAQVVQDLREFIDRYGTIRFAMNAGAPPGEATLYGLGPKVELDAGDRGRLVTMIAALAETAWLAIP